MWFSHIFEMNKCTDKWTLKCVFYSLFSEITKRRNSLTLYSFVFSIKSLFRQNPCTVLLLFLLLLLFSMMMMMMMGAEGKNRTVNLADSPKLRTHTCHVTVYQWALQICWTSNNCFRVTPTWVYSPHYSIAVTYDMRKMRLFLLRLECSYILNIRMTLRTANICGLSI